VAAGIVPDPALAEKAIPLCYITFVSGAEMKASLGGYLQVLFSADPKSVGGSMPGDDFYFAG
ncbi:MAG: ABC transporter substrate-binding protein, partial [Demequinaceae bacterium]|nr:ABC transporter substrate-binding protein [Demequinaceae bacterium]